MFFASDNSGPVPQAVLDVLSEVNQGHMMGYGADPMMDEVRQRIRDLFEAPEAAVYLAATGTAANALALATLVEPFDTVFCSPDAHIEEDECNAPEFYTGGAKLTLVPGSDRMTPDALTQAIESQGNRGVHGPRRGAVSITQVTEMGNVYSLSELQALCDVAKSYGLPVHLDGARFANAAVALGCTPAEMSWKLGVDVAVFGGTKNGLMGVEAVVFFDSSKALEFELRRKRGGHLFSKHRYLSAQMAAYLRNDLWKDLATQANAKTAHLLDGLRKRNEVEIVNDVTANMIFFRAPRALHQTLQSGGARYHLSGGALGEGPADGVLTGRLVCDWSLPEPEIDRFVSLLNAA
ncbi:MAG: aminotransferase class V-fold PLP-dependent enzyme [Marivita sp.]|uniref:threonine aldolase family protein n=1 Tax=Marivita sp. TaxID=2003365 RepID=UPI0025B9602D|nr:aminotransferase class V-fold PLP-dependent enzyme [Marivita sp.]MCI5109069.1 aminotransferase class V-fold PLP-dependent enzyme [Marivita sp.]